ncbi:carbonyl reductase [NADPH] 1 [Papilio machaon]|uniref:carbonyl reductase [NADPH] 1 n=1 Tax=Papilio machaon TaxID=76193 RepID=UPI001E662ED6|nr:carbonyl reductase [NADPH] 1 [Papilio machaon]
MSSNKVAIVTGANKGLGFALVKELCDKLDGIVYLTSRDEKRGIEATEKMKQLGYYAKYHQLDVGNTDSVVKLTSSICKEEQIVDILINNAGILFLKDAKESKYVQAEQTILINFTALVNFTEAMLPFIADGGKIVNISSSSGHLSRIPSEQLRAKISSPNLTLKELQSLMNDYLEAVKVNKDIEDGWGDSPYVVSKVGVNAYTFLLNRRLANRGIKVDCVHPGYVISDMTRGSGNVSPEEAAKVVVKVALDSENGGRYFWHNGDVVPWDGSDPRGYIDGRK